MSEILKALQDFDEYAPPTDRWQSTGQLIREAAAEMERMVRLLPGWTSEPPTVPGWYWRCGHDRVPEPMLLLPRQSGDTELIVASVGSYFREPAKRVYGLWWSTPIAEPMAPGHIDGR